MRIAPTTRPICADLNRCSALVVDGNPSLRSMQATMLRDMGIANVAQASRASDARRVLERRRFDIVLCEYHFDAGGMTGQDLVDDLRRANQLPLATIVIMVTGEAAYANVAEAAEATLDGYLLKPHTAKALEQRLMQARHRKLTLQSIYEAIDAGDLRRGVQLCQAHCESRTPYWLHAARIGVDLSMRLGDLLTARLLCEAVQAAHSLPWARLGVARAEFASGQAAHAEALITSLVEERPNYADAHDLMGRVQTEQGQYEAALESHRLAARITPNNLPRLHRLGLMAFWQGQTAEAIEAFERSVRLGQDGTAFDGQGLMLLALLYHDRSDVKSQLRNHGTLHGLHEKRPDDVRLRRCLALASTLCALATHQAGLCRSHAAAIAADSDADDFDFDAAGGLLALLARMRLAAVPQPEGDAWISRIARRFCVSKASADRLCLWAAEPAHIALIRAGHAHIGSLAEQAMCRQRGGAPADALHGLVTAAAETRNPKLVDLGIRLLARHRDTLDEADALAASIEALRARFGAIPGRQ